jgi:hypothetical protein
VNRSASRRTRRLPVLGACAAALAAVVHARWVRGLVLGSVGDATGPGHLKVRDITLALDTLAVGAGFGVRVITPVAPIRIGVGRTLDRWPRDRSFRLHGSIGRIFQSAGVPGA